MENISLALEGLREPGAEDRLSQPAVLGRLCGTRAMRGNAMRVFPIFGVEDNPQLMETALQGFGARAFHHMAATSDSLNSGS